MKNVTAEQKAKSELRKANFRAIAKKLAEMSDDARMELSAQIGIIPTVEGKGLSDCNSCLLAMQNPAVTMVGGFRQWINAGRAVRKGERGLAIWVPCGGTKSDESPTADDMSEGKGSKPRFMIGTVFDVSQTDAIEAPAPPVDDLSDSVKQSFAWAGK